MILYRRQWRGLKNIISVVVKFSWGLSLVHMCAEISWSSFLIGQEQLTCYSNAAKVERGSPITSGKRRERSDKRETYRKKKRGRSSRKGRALKCPHTKRQKLSKEPQWGQSTGSSLLTCHLPYSGYIFAKWYFRLLRSIAMDCWKLTPAAEGHIQLRHYCLRGE